nr:unnamed protein product [Salmo salar]|eukprot:XP_014030716.1 PREDICTED: uncharacterized protein LOC106587160 [Salmo salar]
MLPTSCVLPLAYSTQFGDSPEYLVIRQYALCHVVSGVNEERRRELMLKGIPEPLSQSSLWDRSVRDNVTHNKMTDQEVNRLRNDVLVPGSRLPTPLQGRVPVLLVQQSGKSQGTEMGSWGTGWDLLLPKAWGMAFWVPLVWTTPSLYRERLSVFLHAAIAVFIAGRQACRRRDEPSETRQRRAALAILSAFSPWWPLRALEPNKQPSADNLHHHAPAATQPVGWVCVSVCVFGRGGGKRGGSSPRAQALHHARVLGVTSHHLSVGPTLSDCHAGQAQPRCGRCEHRACPLVPQQSSQHIHPALPAHRSIDLLF